VCARARVRVRACALVCVRSVLRLAMHEPENRRVQLGANDEQKDQQASKNMQRKYLQATRWPDVSKCFLIPQVHASLHFFVDSFQNEFFSAPCFIFFLPPFRG
jgi:hypothetical protein